MSETHSQPAVTALDPEMRADRLVDTLRRLQEASTAIARAAGRDAIGRELARHAVRMCEARGAVVSWVAAGADATADESGIVTHWAGTDETAVPPPAAALDALRDVGQTGRVALRSADDDSVAIAVPIRTGHRADGAIVIYGVHETRIADAEALLATLAATASASLGTAAVLAESLRERRQSEALAELARALGTTQRLGEVLHLGLRHSAAILGADGADIALVRGDYLHIVAALGCAAPLQGLYFPAVDSVTGRAMLEDRPVIVNAIGPETGVNAKVHALSGVENFVAAPLRTPGGPIGVLSVMNRPGGFPDDDIRVIERLAAQLAVAVVKVRLFEEADEATRDLRSAFDAITSGMAVVDADGFILRHNARLAAIAGRPGDTQLVGRSLYEVILGTPHTPSADEPIGVAILNRAVGRGTLRPETGERVFEVIASPHPQGGAVVTVDDITSFLSLAERYRLVVESTTDAIVITDANGVATFANDASRPLFGREVGGVGLRLSTLVAPAMREAVEDAVLRAMAGEPTRADAEVARPDGEHRTVSMSLAPIRSGVMVSGVVASLRDSTAEALARVAMAAADSRYRNLFETAADAIFTLDSAGVMTSVNAACEGVCGLPRDAIIGRRLLAMVEPSDEAVAAHWMAAAFGGHQAQFECRVRRTDGSLRLMAYSFSPLATEGEITGVLGIARDVTEHRAQAAALERAESRYSNLVESAEDGICTLDEEGRITSANRSFRRIVRLTRRAVIDRHFAELLPEDQRAAVWPLFTAAVSGARQRGEIRFVSHLGMASVLSVSTAPLVERDRVAGVLAILRDVTEERALFEHAARRDKLAALGELVGGVAHEVNSPLAGIMAHGQLLQADVVHDSDARRSADTIVSEARRAARIVGKLLTFARQNPSERIPSDINQVISDTLELRRYPLKMQEVDLVVRLAEGLPLTWADPFQLQQVFINLFSNAEQAVVEHGGPERRIEVRSELRNELRGAEIVVSVTDSGPGIAPEHLPHIFNPFYTTKPRGVGTGLGLSISFGIVREHGGQIQASSPPGQGATFTVHLPVRDLRPPGSSGTPAMLR